MEYYSALKRKEILTHVTTWMECPCNVTLHCNVLKCNVLEDIILSESVSILSQKDNYCMIPLTRGI